MQIDEDLRAQFADLGVSIDVDTPPPETDHDPEAFEVMPCNWPSVCAFLACETQWQVATMTVGHAMGVLAPA